MFALRDWLGSGVEEVDARGDMRLAVVDTVGKVPYWTEGSQSARGVARSGLKAGELASRVVGYAGGAGLVMLLLETRGPVSLYCCPINARCSWLADATTPQVWALRLA